LLSCAHKSPNLVETAGKASLQYLDPEIADKQQAMLLELRCGGSGKQAQTVFPPSVHPSGEIVQRGVIEAPLLLPSGPPIDQTGLYLETSGVVFNECGHRYESPGANWETGGHIGI
jgi:hypothetical protein